MADPTFGDIASEAKSDSQSIEHQIVDGAVGVLQTALSAGEADAEKMVPEFTPAAFSAAKQALGPSSPILYAVDMVQGMAGGAVANLTPIADKWLKGELNLAIAGLQARKAQLGG